MGVGLVNAVIESQQSPDDDDWEDPYGDIPPPTDDDFTDMLGANVVTLRGEPATNGQGDHDHDEPCPPTDPLHLPDDFYAARPVLAHISQAARTRQRSRDAVFHVVLARIAAAVPHQREAPRRSSGHQPRSRTSP